MTQRNYDMLVKLLVVGDCGVGKTKFITRFVEGAYCPTSNSTIGLDFRIKSILLDYQRVKVHICETRSRNRFDNLDFSYYRRATGIVLLYDVTNAESFDNIRCYLQRIEYYSDETVPLVLVGHKNDEDAKRVVTIQMGVELAEQYHLPFMEASAQTNHNVVDVVEMMVRKIVQKSTDHITTVDIATSKPKRCCMR